jgi:hypothetical protein
VFGVSRTNLDEEAIVTGDMMHLEYFGHFRQFAADALFAGHFGGRNSDKGKERLAEGTRIDDRGIAPDHTPGFELSDALHHGRWRKADLSGHVHLGHTAVQLKHVHDAKVCPVKHLRIIS